MLVEQDRHSKRQKANDNRSNESIICGNNILENTVNFTAYVKLEDQKCFCAQQNLIWMQFSPKYQFLINLIIYLQMIL